MPPYFWAVGSNPTERSGAIMQIQVPKFHILGPRSLGPSYSFFLPVASHGGMGYMSCMWVHLSSCCCSHHCSWVIWRNLKYNWDFSREITYDGIVLTHTQRDCGIVLIDFSIYFYSIEVLLPNVTWRPYSGCHSCLILEATRLWGTKG